MQQKSEEWFAARCGRITGSRFASVMALGIKGQSLQPRKNLITQLALERITGHPINEPQNQAMAWGNENESLARDWYAFERDVIVREFGFIIHTTLDYVGVSPDGLVGDDGGCEFKCPYNMERHMNNLMNQCVPDEYIWQVQGCMWVTGRKWWDFVSFDPRFPPQHQGVIVKVERDEELIQRLECECIEINTEINHVIEQLKNLHLS